MKKILSLLLCFVIIVATFSVAVTSITAGAATTLFLEEEYDAQLSCTDDKLYYSFCAPYDGYFEFYSVSDFDLFVTVTDQNGSFITSDDNSNRGGDFKATVYMQKGDVYIFEVTAFSVFYDGRFSVYIKECAFAVTKLEVKKLPLKLQYEYGTIVYDIDYSGLELTATMQNGNTVDFSYDTDNKNINGIPLVFKVDYFSTSAVVEITCGSAKTSFELEILPSQIRSIELINPQTVNLYENSGGYYDDKNNYYHYYYEVPRFDVIVTYADGTLECTDTTKTINGEQFYIYDNQFTDHFTLGENTAYVELMGAQTNFTVKVLKTPVTACDVINAPKKQYTIYDEDYISFNEYTDRFTLYALDLSGLEFTLGFEDGTQKTYTDADVDLESDTIDGERFYVLPCEITGVGTYLVTFNFKGYDISFYTRIGDTDTVFGDADGDRDVSVLDAAAIQMHLVGKLPLSDTKLCLCDTDIDGEVSVLDASKIQMFLAGLIESI